MCPKAACQSHSVFMCPFLLLLWGQFTSPAGAPSSFWPVLRRALRAMGRVPVLTCIPCYWAWCLEAWHLIELCAFLRALHASQNIYSCASSAPIMFSFLQQPNQLKTCIWKNMRLCYYLQLHKPRCSITYTEARPVCWEVTQMLFCRAVLGKAQKEAPWNTRVEVQYGLVVLKCNNRRLNQWN